MFQLVIGMKPLIVGGGVVLKGLLLIPLLPDSTVNGVYTVQNILTKLFEIKERSLFPKCRNSMKNGLIERNQFPLSEFIAYKILISKDTFSGKPIMNNYYFRPLLATLIL